MELISDGIKFADLGKLCCAAIGVCEFRISVYYALLRILRLQNSMHIFASLK